MDLLRLILIGSIGVSTYCRVCRVNKLVRHLLYTDNDLIRSVALYTGGLTKRDLCFFFCLSDVFVRKLPFKQIGYWRQYGERAVDDILWSRQISSLTKRRRFHTKDIAYEISERDGYNERIYPNAEHKIMRTPPQWRRRAKWRVEDYHALSNLERVIVNHLSLQSIEEKKNIQPRTPPMILTPAQRHLLKHSTRGTFFDEERLNALLSL